MKVIWRNNKSIEAGTKNIGCGSTLNGLNKPSHNSLTKMRGFNHHAIGQDQHQPKNKSNEENGLLERPESGDAGKPACRVCGRTDDLRSLDDCNDLLKNCFGVKVVDQSAKICRHCSELILHTQKFKDMVRAAFQPPSQAHSIKDFESLLSIGKEKNGYNSGSEDVFVRKITLKKRSAKPEKSSTKKAIVVCSICKQKYPMPQNINDFVCSRCKIKSASDRTIACVKCRAAVPSALIKEHLEIHTKANLKGRCRLRSLTKKPSKAQTTDCVSKKHNQESQCTRCYQLFSSSQRLEQHMKVSHGEFYKFICHVCGKDMISSTYLERHLKIHSTFKTFECQYCGKIFKSIDAMQRHIVVHELKQ